MDRLEVSYLSTSRQLRKLFVVTCYQTSSLCWKELSGSEYKPKIQPFCVVMQLRLVSGYRIFEVLKERVFQNDIDSIELKLKQIEVLSIRHFYL